MRSRFDTIRSRWLRAVALATVAAVSGCGGGGESSNGDVVVVPGPPTAGPSPTPSPPTPAPTPSAQQMEDQRSNSAVAANAEAAYRAGATGRGVKIAIIDTGITPGLTEFGGRIDPASMDAAGGRGVSDLHGHGTWMSSIALAARDGRGLHGVAYEATVLSYNVSRPGECTPQRCPLDAAPVARAIDAAVAAGARVISMSFAADETDDALLAAVRRAAAAGVVMVVSAGNQDGGTEPRLLSRSIAEAGAGWVIVTGGHDAAGRFFTGGNQAGNGPSAAWHLTALAVDVNMVARDGSLVTFTGTSAATAAISGAVALIAQARPQLTGDRIVKLLLDNATDAGAPGRDPLYGNGILNLSTSFAALGAAG